MNRQDAIDEGRDEHRDDNQEDQGTEGKSDRVINIHEDSSGNFFS